MLTTPRLKLLALLTGYAAVWLFLVGWSFAGQFYERFQLALPDLHMPWAHFFSLAFLAVEFHSGWFLLIVLGWWWFYAAWDPSLDPYVRYLLQGNRWIRDVLLALAFLVLGYFMGGWAAAGIFSQEQRRGFPTLPSVRVVFKHPEAWEQNGNRKQLAEALNRGCYRLLVQGNDPGRLFLFRYQEGEVNGYETDRVAQDDVASVRVLSFHPECPW